MTHKFLDLTKKETFETVLDVLFPARVVLREVQKYVNGSVQAQKQAAVDVIRAGRDSGVESMTIKMDRQAGIDLGANIDGIPIKMKVGDSGTVEVFVKYK
jgi:hypothetical protein